MNQANPNLRLQAYVDGELTPTERAEVERGLAANPADRQMVESLGSLRSLLKASEPVVKVPESPEFYFSKIARQIERESLQGKRLSETASLSWTAWMRKHFVGVAGVGITACLALLLTLSSGGGVMRDGELELASDDMGAYTYRDQQQQVTMVWLYDRTSDDSEFTDSVKADIEGLQ